MKFCCSTIVKLQCRPDTVGICSISCSFLNQLFCSYCDKTLCTGQNPKERSHFAYSATEIRVYHHHAVEAWQQVIKEAGTAKSSHLEQQSANRE